MSKQEKTIEIFDNGYNCSQAVLTAYSEKYNIDANFAMKISTGFGGGMARLQETCGAVIGGIMVLGLATSNLDEDIATNKERVYYLIKLFIKEFKEKYGSIKCSELLNCDLNTEEGEQFYETNNLRKKICFNCVNDVSAILDKLINKYSL